MDVVKAQQQLGESLRTHRQILQDKDIKSLYGSRRQVRRHSARRPSAKRYFQQERTRCSSYSIPARATAPYTIEIPAEFRGVQSRITTVEMSKAIRKSLMNGYDTPSSTRFSHSFRNRNSSRDFPKGAGCVISYPISRSVPREGNLYMHGVPILVRAEGNYRDSVHCVTSVKR